MDSIVAANFSFSKQLWGSSLSWLLCSQGTAFSTIAEPVSKLKTSIQCVCNDHDYNIPLPNYLFRNGFANGKSIPSTNLSKVCPLQWSSRILENILRQTKACIHQLCEMFAATSPSWLSVAYARRHTIIAFKTSRNSFRASNELKVRTWPAEVNAWLQG